MSIKIERSRFSALKIEDDEEEIKQTKSNKNQTNDKNNKKIKNYKSNNSKNQDNVQNKVNKIENNNDWETWKQKDEEFVDELYKEQLKQALIESKIEFENKKSQKQENPNHQKQNKPIKMSLGEFQKSFDTNSHKNENNKNKQIDTQEETKKFIDEIDNKLEGLLVKDKILNNEQLNKDQSGEKYLSLQYKEEMSKRDKEIDILKEMILFLKNEVNEIKQRNQQLALILATGEMKDKSDLIIQLNELNNIKNELTVQVSELHKNFEQEKSKVHQLENELKKIKKH